MKYILVVGANYQKYKKNPIIRIYLNDQFLDEYELTKHQINFTDSQKIITNLDPLPDTNPYSNEIQNWKFLEFNTNKSNININFKIINQDSNYTNGFMTKTTLISFNFCYLLSEKLLTNFENIYKKFSKIKKNFSNKTIIKKYYSNDNIWPVFYNLFENCSIDFKSSNLSLTNSIITQLLLGGSGEININCVKKHGFWLPSNHPLGYKKWGYIELGRYILNKYTEIYENKRSSD